MKTLLYSGLAVLASWTLLSTSSASAEDFSLKGTLFESIASEYQLDPALLYSVALAESASGRGSGMLSPWPWTIRTKDGAVYSLTEDELKAELSSAIEKHGNSIDVGIMQISLRWNGHRVDDHMDLVDPETNIRVGAIVLSEALASSPNDIEIGIGRFHTWKDVARSRNYGQRVMAIYQNLSELGE